jgi:hypothetical protein
MAASRTSFRGDAQQRNRNFEMPGLALPTRSRHPTINPAAPTSRASHPRANITFCVRETDPGFDATHRPE